MDCKCQGYGGVDVGLTYKGYPGVTAVEKITDGNNKVINVKYESLVSSGNYTTLAGVNGSSSIDTNYCNNPENWTPIYGFRGIEVDRICSNPTIYSLNAANFYTQLNEPFGAASAATSVAPVLEIFGPKYVVTDTELSAPVAGNWAATNKVSYFYHHDRVQAGGRGYLGFEKISTIDQQTGVKTETTYHQDWPLTGMPKLTSVKSKEGNLLSQATNTWTVIANQKQFRVYLGNTEEKSYSLSSNGAAQGALLQTMVTNNINDEYGNQTYSSSQISGSANNSLKTITNEYYPTEWELFRGRLFKSTSQTSKNSETPVVRTSQFEYYGRYEQWPGLLKTEIIEPGVNQLATVYEYDLVGNQKIIRKTANVKPGVQQTRKTEMFFDVSNRFAETVKDGYGNFVSGVIERNELNQPKQIKDKNGVITNIAYKNGQEYQRRDTTGAWAHVKRALCGGYTDTGASVSCPTGARYRVENWVSGGGVTTTYIDVLGQTLRTSKLMFDGSWSHVDTEYDVRGLIVRQSEPYISSPEYWTTYNGYDILGRPINVALPNGTMMIKSYDGYSTTTTVDVHGKALKNTEEKNSLGHLIKVTDNLNSTINYSYDVLGNITNVITSTATGDKTVKIQMCYDKLGRKIAMHDPDKGGFLGNANYTCGQVATYASVPAANKLTGWWFYQYNDFGELIEQTDTKKQVTTMDYDLLGRMLNRTDRFANGSVDTHTTWFYDRPYGTSGTYTSYQGALAAVVTSYGRINSECSGSNYCQTYTRDSAARVTDTVTYLPNNTVGYINSVKYDAIGRVDEVKDVLNGLVGVSGTKNIYNTKGYVSEIRDLASGDVLQKTIATNARGQITQEKRLNGAAGDVINDYYPATGLIKNTKSSIGGSLFALQDVTYDWDAVGNLKSRWNQSSNIGRTAKKDLQESFCYDALNRLIKSHQGTLAGSCSLSASAQDQEYDGLGNILRKNGVGTYAYGTTAGPHAVTSTSSDGVYAYDGNGNQISGANRSMVYSSHDQLTQVSKGVHTVDFKYGPDRARYEQVKTNSSNGQKTLTQYLGNVERIEQIGSGVVEWKRYIAGAIYTLRTTATNCGGSLCYALQSTDKSFIYNDHLGSLDVVVNNVGTITHTASFDAWGSRRNGETWGAFLASSLTLTNFTQPITTRGFTGHEMLDDVGIIHMNGRVYDPRLSRFLQADPFIDGVTQTQGYNRYSYVYNNPLNATDPTGHFIVLVVAVMMKMAAVKAVAAAVIIGMFTAAQAYASGASGWEAIGIGIVAGLAAGVGNGAFSKMSDGMRLFGGAALGGVQSKMVGGKFGHGFVSAYMGTVAGQAGDGWTGLFVSTVVGGTVSEMTGGKFRNGAKSAAMSYVVMWGAEKIGEGQKVEKNIGVEYFDKDKDSVEFSYEEKMILKKALISQRDELNSIIAKAKSGDASAIKAIRENIGSDMSQVEAGAKELSLAVDKFELNKFRRLYSGDPGELAHFDHISGEIRLSKTVYDYAVVGKTNNYSLIHEIGHFANFGHGLYRGSGNGVDFARVGAGLSNYSMNYKNSYAYQALLESY